MENKLDELLRRLESGEELSDLELRAIASSEKEFVNTVEIMTRLQIYTDGRMQTYIDNMETIKYIRSGLYDVDFVDYVSNNAVKPNRLERSIRRYNSSKVETVRD